jgi:hypothetical protein
MLVLPGERDEILIAQHILDYDIALKSAGLNFDRAEVAMPGQLA